MNNSRRILLSWFWFINKVMSFWYGNVGVSEARPPKWCLQATPQILKKDSFRQVLSSQTTSTQTHREQGHFEKWHIGLVLTWSKLGGLMYSPGTTANQTYLAFINLEFNVWDDYFQHHCIYKLTSYGYYHSEMSNSIFPNGFMIASVSPNDRLLS